MVRAVKLLQSALDTVGDRHAISLLRPPLHLKESFPRNQPTNKKEGKSTSFKNKSHQSDFKVLNSAGSYGSVGSSGGGGGVSHCDHFPTITGLRGRRFITGSSVIVFNLALCYHFGRGIEQVCVSLLTQKVLLISLSLTPLSLIFYLSLK